MRFRPRTSPYALAEAGSDAEAADAGAPWTEWYLWRPTPDAAFDAAEVAVALEPTLRVDLAKLDMLPDTPVPGLSGLPVALDVVDAKRGVVDDDDWLRSGDVLVGLDGAPLENGVDAAAMLARSAAAAARPSSPCSARGASAQFWIRAKCAQERSKARSAVRRPAARPADTAGAPDLAEWMPLKDPSEPVGPGDLVEMVDKKISRVVTGRGRCFVVPIKVVGAVRESQCLAPSGRDDGTAVATARHGHLQHGGGRGAARPLYRGSSAVTKICKSGKTLVATAFWDLKVEIHGASSGARIEKKSREYWSGKIRVSPTATTGEHQDTAVSSIEAANLEGEVETQISDQISAGAACEQNSAKFSPKTLFTRWTANTAKGGDPLEVTATYVASNTARSASS
ncbi:hypothetical protein JL720_11091 [Aureococcus anophagefferens]|nr:hypothetical protein JL720_11091 [Aureococcus anophagefferens]